jgi:tRNA modification GTPase
MLHIHGLPFRLVDTAGLREHTHDFIESSGMERTRKELAQADVILEVVDASRPQAEAHRVPLPPGKHGHILVFNKADLGMHASWDSPGAVLLSCQSGAGIDALRSAMRDAVWSGTASPNQAMVAINARHQSCFQRALEALDRAQSALQRREAPEFIALDLREGLQAVGEVTGRVDVEEILGAVFSQFCIGK